MYIEQMKTYYRPMIQISVTGKYIRQSGSHDHFAVVDLTIEPIQENHTEIECIVKEPVRQEFLETVKKTLLECVDAEIRILSKYPVIGAKIKITKILEQQFDSSNMDFRIAAIVAWKEIMRQVEWKICQLEPIETQF